MSDSPLLRATAATPSRRSKRAPPGSSTRNEISLRNWRCSRADTGTTPGAFVLAGGVARVRAWRRRPRSVIVTPSSAAPPDTTSVARVARASAQLGMARTSKPCPKPTTRSLGPTSNSGCSESLAGAWRESSRVSSTSGQAPGNASRTWPASALSSNAITPAALSRRSSAIRGQTVTSFTRLASSAGNSTRNEIFFVGA